MGLNRIHLLYNTVTGDPGDPLYFPLNAVRWHTRPRELAALVTDASRERFEARLFHFGPGERRFDAELFLLAPGEYEFLVTAAATTRTLTQTRVTISATNRRVSLELPAGVECLLRIARERVIPIRVQDEPHR